MNFNKAIELVENAKSKPGLKMILNSIDVSFEEDPRGILEHEWPILVNVFRKKLAELEQGSARPRGL